MSEVVAEYTLVSKERYDQLKVAIQDLLCELRIGHQELATMANGYSPDYPGAIDCKEGEEYTRRACKVQISKVVAQKLIAAGI